MPELNPNSGSNRKVEFAAIKMPKEFGDFVKNNEELAKLVGRTLIEINTAKKVGEALKELFTKPELFKKYIKDDPNDQLEGFLKAMLAIANETEEDGKGSFLHAKGVPEDEFLDAAGKVKSAVLIKADGHINKDPNKVNPQNN